MNRPPPKTPTRAATPSGDPYLLTPGPLTTSPTVKQAMLRDYGSRDKDFIELNARVLARLVAIVGGKISDKPDGKTGHVAVPLQGSGTFRGGGHARLFCAGRRQTADLRQRRLRASHGQNL